MDVDPTEAWRELAAIAEALAELPEDDFEARAPLLARRTEIRDAVRSNAITSDEARSDADLRAEAAALEAAIESHIAGRVDLVQQAGSSLAEGAGASGWGGVQLNQAVDAAQGLPALQARLRRVRSILAERSG